MTVKLIGKINSEPVIFQWKEGDRWEAIVPRIPSGVYVVELSAYDEAGNMTYVSQFLLSIDLTALCMRVMIHEIGSRNRAEKFCADVLPDHFSAIAKSEKYNAEAKEKAVFFCKMRVGEPCDFL